MVHISSSSTDVIEEMLRLPAGSKNCRSKLYEQFTHFQQEAWQSLRESSPIQLLRSRLGEGDISQRLSLMLHGGRQIMEVDVAV